METLKFLLDTFITLADRIINLEKTQIQNKQQAFKEIVEPLFLELQPVVDNYISLFRNAKKSVIESSPDNLWGAVSEVRQAREAMILSRIKVREMANRVQEAYKDKRITEFAQKVDGFFYRTVCEREVRTTSSYAKELVDLCEYVMKRDMDKSELIKFIEDALKNLEISWVAIAQSYASVRIYCLSSPTLTKKTGSRNF
jgi:hypothetical protein